MEKHRATILGLVTFLTLCVQSGPLWPWENEHVKVEATHPTRRGWPLNLEIRLKDPALRRFNRDFIGRAQDAFTGEMLAVTVAAEVEDFQTFPWVEEHWAYWVPSLPALVIRTNSYKMETCAQGAPRYWALIFNRADGGAEEVAFGGTPWIDPKTGRIFQVDYEQDGDSDESPVTKACRRLVWPRIGTGEPECVEGDGSAEWGEHPGLDKWKFRP